LSRIRTPKSKIPGAKQQINLKSQVPEFQTARSNSISRPGAGASVPPDAAGDAAAAEQEQPKDDDVIDAEFEEVDDDKKK